MNKVQMCACIDEYRQKSQKLEDRNATLESENRKLKYIMHDIKSTKRMMQESIDRMRDDIEQELASECGCVILSNSTCYQDFVGILLNNGYTVEVEPIHKGRSLKIIIKEGGGDNHGK